MGVDGCVIYSRVEEHVEDNSRSFKAGERSNEMGCVPVFLFLQHRGLGT
jgi:hypothetical protein